MIFYENDFCDHKKQNLQTVSVKLYQPIVYETFMQKCFNKIFYNRDFLGKNKTSNTKGIYLDTILVIVDTKTFQITKIVNI